MKNKKIALIGGGQIGGTIAHLASIKELGDIAIVDIKESIAEGKALDISQSLSIQGCDIKVSGSACYELIQDADVIIVTAGVPRKPGMKRDDLLKINLGVMEEVGNAIKTYACEAFVICITNPLDIMTWALQKFSSLAHNKVVGMAGVLDNSRFKYFLAKELDISVENIVSFVLGGHGDDMVPMVRYTSVGGIPLNEIMDMGWISKQQLEDVVKNTRFGGGQIISLLKTGSAFYSPAASAIFMAEAYLKNKRRIISCSAYLDNIYQLHDIYAGVPSLIGKNGVEKILELSLDEDIKKDFLNSTVGIKKGIEDCKKLNPYLN